MATKIGLLAYSSDTGLGNQTWEIYKHILPAKTLVVDLSEFNKMQTNHDRYPDGRVVRGIPTNQDMEWLVDEMDVVIVCETPLNYHLYRYAKEKGVRTVQQYNREFLDFYKHPEWAQPTYLAYPAKWEIEKVEALNLESKLIPLPVPINRNKIEFREFKELRTIVHILGRPAYMDRNGTIPFLEAALNFPQYNYLIYLQPPTDQRATEYFEPVRKKLEEVKSKLNIKVVESVPNYEDMYKTGELLVLPRRYAGLCLPMQEALAAGIPVIMTDVSPNYEILPKDWLCSASKTGEFYFHAPVDVYSPNVESLVDTIRKFENPDYLQMANNQANLIAEALSWDNLRSMYTSL